MDAAPVAVLAAAEDGSYIYENQAAELLLGYDPIQLCSMYMTDLVQADPQWLLAGLDCLKRRHVWSGRVPYRPRLGGIINVTVNAFLDTCPDDAAKYVALLHPLSQDSRPPAVVSEPGSLYGLTSHEICLLQLMSEGFANKEIAGILGINVFTADNGVRRILQKMKASSRTQVCIMALKAHIVL